MKESALMREIRFAVNSSGLARVFRNNVGYDSEHAVKYGLAKGSPDLVGFVLGSGRFLGIEVKTARGRLSDDQTCWLEAAASHGALVGVARSVAEAMQIVRGER